jgi:hypothetical protein
MESPPSKIWLVRLVLTSGILLTASDMVWAANDHFSPYKLRTAATEKTTTDQKDAICPGRCLLTNAAACTADLVAGLRARNSADDARVAAEAGEFRPVAFVDAPVGAVSVRALGADCASRPKSFRESLGFMGDRFTDCLMQYHGEARRYVTDYNHALRREAAKRGVDICAAQSRLPHQ